MATQRDVEYNQLFFDTCALLDGLSLVTVLIVAHLSSPGPSGSQSVRRGYVNPFFRVVILSRNTVKQHSNGRIAWKTIPSTIRRACRGPSYEFVLDNSLMSRWVLIFSLVLRAVNVPSIKKYRYLKRKLFVTVSDSETTAKTADVSVEGKVAKWNQVLDGL